MLGDGMVIFGTAVRTCSDRNRKSSVKIGSSRCSGSRTARPAAMNWPVPSSLRNCTTSLLVGAGDTAEPVDEVHVPRRAAELPVGGRAQADVLLQRDDVADRLVLDRAQAGGVDPACREVVAGLHQRARAQQAPDVVGPERRLGAGVHRRAT